MSLHALALRLLAEPSPEVVWQMHPALLALDSPAAQSASEAARLFYAYWNALQSKLSAKQASTLAAALAAGSVGGVALQEFLHTLRDDPGGVIRSLLMTGAVGMFEMLSAVQHIRAWDVELGAAHHEVVWTLYEQYWRLSCEMQPDLSAADRRRHIAVLVEPIRDVGLDTPSRLLLTIRLLQVLLVLRLAPLLSRENADPSQSEVGA